MVENLSPEPDVITNPELEEGIKNDSITTFTITKESLPDYEEAAGTKECKGFEVQVIAEQDQCYPTTEPPRRLKMGNKTKIPTIIVVSSEPVKPGYVAISLKKPEGVPYDTAFNLARQQIEQRRLTREEKRREKE